MENRSALERMETSNFITIEERHREMLKREKLEKRKLKFVSLKNKNKKFFKRSVNHFKNINFDRFKNNRRNTEKNERDPIVHSLLRNTAICAVAVLAIYGIKMIDSPITNSITASVKQAISYEMNLDNTLGKLQFVNENATSTQTFNEVPDMDYPMKGEIKTRFADSDSTGITMTAVKGTEVYSAANGIVAVVGEDSMLGKYVQIKHTDTIYSTYYGLTDITVKKGDSIAAKQKIGVLNSTELLFEVKNNGRPVDPEQYIDDGKI